MVDDFFKQGGEQIVDLREPFQSINRKTLIGKFVHKLRTQIREINICGLDYLALKLIIGLDFSIFMLIIGLDFLALHNVYCQKHR
jgi:hypothetical protein